MGVTCPLARLFNTNTYQASNAKCDHSCNNAKDDHAKTGIKHRLPCKQGNYGTQNKQPYHAEYDTDNYCCKAR